MTLALHFDSLILAWWLGKTYLLVASFLSADDELGCHPGAPPPAIFPTTQGIRGSSSSSDTREGREACSSISSASSHGYALPTLLTNRLERRKDAEGRGGSARRRNDLSYSVLRLDLSTSSNLWISKSDAASIKSCMNAGSSYTIDYSISDYCGLSFYKSQHLKLKSSIDSTLPLARFSLMEVFTPWTRVRDVQKVASSLDARAPVVLVICIFDDGEAEVIDQMLVEICEPEERYDLKE
ncbi:hypothetical protein VNO77_18676 [Canavalia gladiata]|uniref:Uncharacterized protein n=1 Tax=Canavalia gladiata TaxID=3824 RepID=A0AAN9LQ50_CANGL